MKFFHVYNEECIKGLEKNGMLNQDSGFKIQHAFSVPESRKFNQMAAKGSPLYQIIKDGKIPFYVDRIYGGIIYHKYDFDKNLVREYEDLLGDWFLGFQLHESASNVRMWTWRRLVKIMGSNGPYDLEALKNTFVCPYAKLPDGTQLGDFAIDDAEWYAKQRYAETPQAFHDEMRDMFSRKMMEVGGKILPCDSFYLYTKLQDELGMRTFMPEVGWQIPYMRIQVALSRGIAKAAQKTWGTYYECWRWQDGSGNSMPCFNTDPSNEWYLNQEMHPDDFSSYGKNGGSSRLLQNRIYYYSLMSGADYMSEEWGLNCSYTDMQEFSLSEYGQLKKDFIHHASTLRGMKAKIPFAIVLPKDYQAIELLDRRLVYKLGEHRGKYLDCVLDAAQTKYYGHLEDVLMLFFGRNGETYGNEGHVITNSRFGDVFDIIYEDTNEEAMKQYDYLIDATESGAFASKMACSDFKVLRSDDLEELALNVERLIEEIMPVSVEGLCWLVSEDDKNKRYLSIFNNEGNDRTNEKGDELHAQADQTVRIRFKDPVTPSVVKEGNRTIKLQKVDERTYLAEIPATGVVVLEF